ncbi:MAG TPA: glycosyltransferase family 4 protein [Candidatus Limnocylindria bacterium]
MRILIVVQRYGADVVGGSESHARSTAMRLSLSHHVEIATTTASDFWTWASHYPAGDDEVDGLRVRRFPVASGRSPSFKEIEDRLVFGQHSLADEERWLAAQGPHCPELLEFLHREGRSYDAVLFYTYIYEPTALGLRIVPERSALISTAHDEWPLRFAPYRALFQMPRAFGFLTPEERDVVHGVFHNGHIPYEVIGVGMDAPPEDRDASYRTRFPAGPLVVYLGQVREGKGVGELLDGWTAYRDGGGRGTLALAGVQRMEIASRDDVVALGRVSDEEKWSLLACADVLVLPSRLESLGIVLLEAWQVGTPVLVPSANKVTSGQVTRSGGGWVYDDGAFAPALAGALGAGRAPGESARRWVREECSWESFDRRLGRLLELAAA